MYDSDIIAYHILLMIQIHSKNKTGLPDFRDLLLYLKGFLNYITGDF